MEGLPFLPGNTFSDPTRNKFHVSHTLDYKNGYARAKLPEVGIGGRPIIFNQLSEAELDELANFNPTLTYGQAKQAPPQDFIPAHVAWDKKVLRFNGYFKQTVHESPNEYYRVRPIDIYYYLEDDSIAVMEPQVDNSGIPQGCLIRRQRLPKNDRGDNWHWKDINNGTNVTFYGKVFHVVNCDKFTKDFLESEGIVVNSPEEIPGDPYIEQRKKAAALRTFNTPSSFDKLKQFLELDRKVLRFFCVWDDRHNMFGEIRQFIIHYYLVDDTLEVREVHLSNDGHDPFPVLIGRHKVPKDRYKIPSSFPAASMELSDNEVKEYLTPKDFKIGQHVNIYGRRFFVYDIDNFTKAFYYQHFGITDFTSVDVKGVSNELPKMEIPPYNNFGSLEDSMQSCLTLIPKPPRKDYVKMIENDRKVLRFEAVMDSVRPEDASRRFIISYRLADDMITIYEPQIRNSGIIGGKFLERCHVAKPNSTSNSPVYYGPQDFYIGAVVDVFGHRFVISGADDYVLKYMEEHAHRFPAETIESIRQKLSGDQRTKEIVKGGPMKVKREPGDLAVLVKQVRAQLKRISITDKPRVDEMFLRYNTDRTGYLSVKNLQDLCYRLQLPVDDDVIAALVREMTSDVEGRVNLEDFRCFIETS